MLLLAAVAYTGMAGHPAASPVASPAAALASLPAVSAPSGASTVGSPPSAAPAMSAVPSASPSPGPFPDPAERAILAGLPPALAHTCVRGGTPDDARLAGFTGVIAYQPYTPMDPSASHAGVTCYPATGAARLYVMAPVSPRFEYNSAFGGASAPGDVYLGYLAGARNLPFGSCATDKRAYERWASPSGSGTLACMNPYDGRPWIYFTFGKGIYLAFATRDDSDYAALYQWWEQLKIFLP